MKPGVEHGKSGQAKDVYHGTKKMFQAFRVPGAKNSNEQFDFGIHFASDRRFAELYAGPIGWVYRCDIWWNRIFDAMAVFPGPMSADIHFVDGGGIIRRAVSVWMRGRPKEHLKFLEGGVYGKLIDAIPGKTLFKLLEEEGFDAVRYEAIASRGRAKISSSESFVVLRSENIEIKQIEEPRT